MKTLIIPDIHTRWQTADRIIQHEPFDKLVLLGDYVDNFNDTVKDNVETLNWLKRVVAEPNVTALYGNHELSYIDEEKYACAGWEMAKAVELKSRLRDLRGYLQLATKIDGYLISHAGINLWFIGPEQDPWERIIIAERALLNDKNDALLHAGASRGGRIPVGGVVWQDWYEFQNIPGLPQIVGHTPHPFVKRKPKNNWNLDTHLKDYAILEDGVVTPKKVSAITSKIKI